MEWDSKEVRSWKWEGSRATVEQPQILLSKRREKLQEVDVSRAAAGTINKAQKDLEGLTYLNWLFLFVKVRSAKSNFTTYKETGKTSLDDDV